MRTPLDKLKKIADDNIRSDELREAANFVLENQRFPTWTASPSSKVHHYGEGGLVQHTLEVAELCLLNNKYFCSIGEGVDTEPLFLAALFHDIGKIRDYELYDANEDKTDSDFDWQYRSCEHKYKIHHISASAIMWSGAMIKLQDKYSFVYNEVLHAILAHHGRREWGSPVEPQTGIAWLLHLSDNMSARMDDKDKRVDRNK